MEQQTMQRTRPDKTHEDGELSRADGCMRGLFELRERVLFTLAVVPCSVGAVSIVH